MSSAQAVLKELKNPGKFYPSSELKFLLWVLVGAGFLSSLILWNVSPKRFWSILLVDHFYFLCLSLGGLFFAALQWITRAMWSAPIRRISEALTAYLPIAFLVMILLFFALPQIYKWTDATRVLHDTVLKEKSVYLNTSFFIVRNVIFFLIWIFFAKLLVGRSLKQDETGDYRLTLKNSRNSAFFFILFAFSFTFFSFDQLMSLDPHWFSAVFGIYCFAGLFYSTLALICLGTIYFHQKGYLESFVNENHLHDLGKLMFAFTAFWAYIGFVQFMLIWYANIPEETTYFLHRLQHGWFAVSIFLFIGKFLVPFLILLPRSSKRRWRTLWLVGLWMLFCQWVDVIWMVQPEFFKVGPQVGLFELGVTLGFVGVFGLSVVYFLSRHCMVAIGDPRLKEAVFCHHQ